MMHSSIISNLLTKKRTFRKFPKSTPPPATFCLRWSGSLIGDLIGRGPWDALFPGEVDAETFNLSFKDTSYRVSFPTQDAWIDMDELLFHYILFS